MTAPDFPENICLNDQEYLDIGVADDTFFSSFNEVDNPFMDLDLNQPFVNEACNPGLNIEIGTEIDDWSSDFDNNTEWLSPNIECGPWDTTLGTSAEAFERSTGGFADCEMGIAGGACTPAFIFDHDKWLLDDQRIVHENESTAMFQDISMLSLESSDGFSHLSPTDNFFSQDDGLFSNGCVGSTYCDNGLEMSLEAQQDLDIEALLGPPVQQLTDIPASLYIPNDDVTSNFSLPSVADSYSLYGASLTTRTGKSRPPQDAIRPCLLTSPKSGASEHLATDIETTCCPWLPRHIGDFSKVEAQLSVAGHESIDRIEKIKGKLAKIFYPTTIANVPGLLCTFPAEKVNRPDFDPENPEDLSSFSQGEQEWTVENPPFLLGMLDPPPDYYDHLRQPVPVLVDEDLKPVENTGNGLKVRNLPFLPRYLSSSLSAIHWEMFMRLDPRVKYNDVRSRQPKYLPRMNQTTINNQNNRRGRGVRRPLNVRCWETKYVERPTKYLCELLDNLTEEQIEHNTTWVVTKNGIHPPNNPKCIYKKKCFKKAGHKMSQETSNAFKLLEELKSLAQSLGEVDWRNLPKERQPSHWKIRQEGMKRKREDREEGAAKMLQANRKIASAATVTAAHHNSLKTTSSFTDQPTHLTTPGFPLPSTETPCTASGTSGVSAPQNNNGSSANDDDSGSELHASDGPNNSLTPKTAKKRKRDGKCYGQGSRGDKSAKIG